MVQRHNNIVGKHTEEEKNVVAAGIPQVSEILVKIKHHGDSQAVIWLRIAAGWTVIAPEMEELIDNMIMVITTLYYVLKVISRL